ncbi:hypothetical protein TWF718_005043 [Orbilia javanica]|uniref:Uncharacterized protein n=1 Tax=Orbilia javanica TaxID=47235 RepID=A0AAN8MYN7_9PEZI
MSAPPSTSGRVWSEVPRLPRDLSRPYKTTKSEPGARFSALSYDANRHSWRPCLDTTSGRIDSDVEEDLQYIQQPEYKRLIQSTGRLTNELTMGFESGFWIFPDVFFSALHLWKPGDELSIRQSHRNPKFHLSISIKDYNARGSRQDRESSKVFLEEWSTQHDLGIFVLNPKSEPSPSWLNIDRILETHELINLNTTWKGKKVFAVGYNDEPDLELKDYLAKYKQLRPEHSIEQVLSQQLCNPAYF